jgi:hypothetical protein
MLNKIDYSDRLKDLHKRKGIFESELADLIQQRSGSKY